MENVEHDFTLVNEAMRTAQRKGEMRSTAEARALWLPKLGTAAVGVGLGFALAMLGLSFARSPDHTSAQTEHGGFPKLPKSEEVRPGPQDSKEEKIVTDYVIFNNVVTAKGRIETGWHYGNEAQTRPDRQWCHLVSTGADGTGTITPYDRLSYDLMSKCRWFQGVVQND